MVFGYGNLPPTGLRLARTCVGLLRPHRMLGDLALRFAQRAVENVRQGLRAAMSTPASWETSETSYAAPRAYCRLAAHHLALGSPEFIPPVRWQAARLLRGVGPMVPLVNLGARDPVDRIATTKAVDPGRNNILVVYEAWWAAHGNKEVPAKNLDSSVVDAIAETAAGRDGGIRYSRQYIAKWLVKHTNTRVGGYVLISILIESPKTPRPVYHYALKLTKNE